MFDNITCILKNFNYYENLNIYVEKSKNTYSKIKSKKSNDIFQNTRFFFSKTSFIMKSVTVYDGKKQKKN